MVNCEICKEKKANRWINGKRVCLICYLSLKHIHYLPFTRALKKNNLYERFLQLHPEVIHISHIGISRVSNSKIMAYLKENE